MHTEVLGHEQSKSQRAFGETLQGQGAEQLCGTLVKPTLSLLLAAKLIAKLKASTFLHKDKARSCAVAGTRSINMNKILTEMDISSSRRALRCMF